jgi:hypothetical protein
MRSSYDRFTLRESLRHTTDLWKTFLSNSVLQSNGFSNRVAKRLMCFREEVRLDSGRLSERDCAR